MGRIHLASILRFTHPGNWRVSTFTYHPQLYRSFYSSPWRLQQSQPWPQRWQSENSIMAKERPEKPLEEEAEKSEKKISKDKVKKHKKEKKPKPNPSSDVYDDELATALVKHSSESTKKERRKKTKNLKMAAQKAAAAEADNTHGKEFDRSADFITADAEPDNKVDHSADFFTIDTEPTPVDLDAIPAKGADEDDSGPSGSGNPAQTGPPSGLNRKVRRRLKLIERQREKIQKDLGVTPGSPEGDERVQSILDGWTAVMDEKAALRAEKKESRKKRSFYRLVGKSGKVLSGRRLLEREKQLNQIAKKAAKKEERMYATMRDFV